MSASAFHVTRTSTGIRVWFTVLNANRTLRTGLVAGNFTVTLIRNDDGAVNNPTVSESTQLSGAYFFDVPSAFLTTNGDNYFMVIQVTLAPVDVLSAPLFVTQRLWDQLTQPSDLSNLDVAVSTREAESAAATREATNTTEHAATLTAVGLVETEASAATREATNTAEHAATLAAVGLTETEAAALARATAILAAVALTETEAAAATREATNTAEHAATLAAIAALQTLTPTQDAALTYLLTHAGGVNGNKMNHTRATIATPGRAFSDDNTVDQTVTQVDADTATFEQVP